MGLLDKAKQNFIMWLIKSNPVATINIEQGYEGEEQPVHDDIEANLSTYRVEPYVYRCLNANGISITSSPIITEERKSVDGELAWEKVEQGEVYDLFTSPNPEYDWQYLLWLVSIALDGSGNSYLPFDKISKELYYVDPSTAKVVGSAENGVEGYTFKKNGKTVRLEADEVCHIKLPNPFDSFYGLSPIEAAKMPILTLYHDRRYLKDYYKNNAIPGSLLSSDQPNPGEDSIKQATKEWNRLYSGAGNNHKTAMLWNGLKHSVITPPLKDLVMDELRKMSREEIATCFGVPPVALGIVDNANLANSRDQWRGYWESTIIPRQRLISSALTTQIVHPHFGEQYRVRFDNSKQEFLQEDQKVKADRVNIIYSAGLITLNEGREILGFDAVDEGDEFKATPTIGFPNDVTNEDDNKSLKPSTTHGSVKTDNPRLKLWMSHTKKMDKIEASFEKTIKKYWDSQLDRILDALKKETNNGKFMWKVGQALFKADEVNPSRENIDNLFDKDAENLKLRESFGELITSTAGAAGQDALDNFAINFTFKIDNPEVQTLIQNALNRSQRINDTTYKQYKKLLQQAYEEGIGVDELERRTRDLFKSYYKTKPGDPNAITRGKRFARTESNSVVNGASMESWKQAGVESKEWLATQDGNTRDIHAIADGEVVPIKQPFIRTGEPLDHPGDPGGSAGNVINCRCTMIPKIN